MRGYAPVSSGAGIELRYQKTASATSVQELPFDLLAEVQSTNFTDEVPRSQATSYLYKVIAVNRWQVEGRAAPLSVRVPATLPPSVPTLLAVVAAEQNDAPVIAVRIRPNVVEEEVSRYRVFRKRLTPERQTSTPPGGVRGKTAQAQISFAGQALGTQGKVTDRLGAGASRFGIARHDSPVTPLARALANPTLIQAPSSLVFRGLLGADGFEEIGVADADKALVAGEIRFIDAKVEPETVYLYQVVAENRDALRSEPSTALDGSALREKAERPGAANVTAIKGGVKLSWSASQDARGYIVQRATQDGATFLQISGIVNVTSFTDYSALPGRTYIYRVRATDSSGNLSDVVQSKITVPSEASEKR